ncbi:MAG: IS1096 element passenger TnpR family protein [Trueperaceae bacterium]
MDIYTLKVTLTDWEGRTRGHPYRILAVPADTSLYDLAFEINESFEFEFDHAFGFFDNLKNPWRASEQYELFNDSEEDDESDEILAELEEELEELTEEEIAEVDALSELPPDEAKKKLIGMSLKDVPPEDKAMAQFFLENMLDEVLDDALTHEDGAAPQGVRSVAVSEVFAKGKKLLYLFDYGDEWRFIVECKKIEASDGGNYPRVLESKGEAPEQYPDYDEDDNDEDDEDGEERIGYKITPNGLEPIAIPKRQKPKS